MAWARSVEVQFKRIPVDANDLSTGMYVVMLDRPWLETPFVFQGFEIKDQQEIDLLQSYCQFVYVDIHRGSLSDLSIQSLLESGKTKPLGNRSSTPGTPEKAGWSAAVRALLARLGMGTPDEPLPTEEEDVLEVSSTVRGEAPRAIEAVEQLQILHKSIIDTARSKGLVDVARVTTLVKPMIASVMRNPNAIAWTIFSRKRSDRKYNRAIATAVWAVMFGRQLGFDQEALQDLAVGGLLLDIGNVDLSEEILNTEGSITIDQYEHLSRHVHLGLEILQASRGMRQNVLDMVRCHHERSNGSGYPEQLRGNNIPVFGRIAGIADCYDAMTTKTLYSPAMAAYDAARELNEMRAIQFPAEVVEQFLSTIGMFPTGSVIQLSNGEIGVVLEQNPARPLRPKVMLLLDKDRQAFGRPKILNMQKMAESESTASEIWIEKGHEHGAFGIDPARYFSHE
jgi:HD-GYP domain-containing protein (c-di-GMP phosphodiesterase class II)